MDKPELFEKVTGKTKPPMKDFYTTNFGRLFYDGKAFIVPGHKNRTTIEVDWWLKLHVE